MMLKYCGFIVLVIVCSILTAGLSFGQDRTVVIPLNSTKPAVVDYSQGGFEFLSPEELIIHSVTLELPANGLVIANASGYFDWYFTEDRESYGKCSISLDRYLDSAYMTLGGSLPGYTMNVDAMPFALTRTFPLEKGTYTFNLVCNNSDSSDNRLAVSRPTLNAVYYYQPDIEIPSPARKSAASSNCEGNEARCR